MRRVALGESDAVHPLLREGFHQVHAGNAALGNELLGRLGMLRPRHQQPGRAVHQVPLEQLLFFRCIVMCDAHQRLVPGRQERALNTLEQIDEKLIRQQRNQYRHVRALARCQRACGRVRYIPEAVGCGNGTLHQFGRHFSVPAQCT